jgi:chemotaxis protein CheD
MPDRAAAREEPLAADTDADASAELTAEPAARLSLAERMAQARDRTVAARIGRGGLPAVAAESLGTGGPAARVKTPLQPSPMIHKPPPRSQPVLAARAAPAAAPVAARAAGWEVSAKPGEQLMLMPGQMHFGRQVASLRTLLGSCVAVTLWHPAKRLGGMCHFLLPSRQRRPGDPLEGKYGDEALEVMVARLRAGGTDPREFEAHLYGGADTMPEGTGVKFNVGERNIEQGWQLIDHYGFQLQGVDVGEDVPRTVTLNFADGGVEMRRGQGRAPAAPVAAPPASTGLPGFPSLPAGSSAGKARIRKV